MNITDSTGNSVITLGAVTGQVNLVTQAGLALPAVSQTQSADANTPFSQASTTVSITTNSLVNVYVPQFDWTSSAVSAFDEGAIRMGMAGNVTSMTADDYPGATFPHDATQQADDGHKVTVKATIIATVPEPHTGGLLAFGVLLLALRNCTRSRR